MEKMIGEILFSVGLLMGFPLVVFIVAMKFGSFCIERRRKTNGEKYTELEGSIAAFIYACYMSLLTFVFSVSGLLVFWGIYLIW